MVRQTQPAGSGGVDEENPTGPDSLTSSTIEKISLKDVSPEERILLLKELGYGSDGIYVLNKDGKILIDEYVDQPVKIDNMLILEGSTLILDNNPLSIAAYLEDYPDAKL